MRKIFIGFMLLSFLAALDSCTKSIPGCTNPKASNYNSSATQDNGSCTILGCTDPTAFNYDPTANTNNGSCVAKVYGCTDATASNYNPNANESNNSCTYNQSVIFWTETNYGTITVSISGQSGVITEYVTNFVTPSCGTGGCVTFSLPLGTYNWSAVSVNGNTWSNTVTLSTPNGCQPEQLL